MYTLTLFTARKCTFYYYRIESSYKTLKWSPRVLKRYFSYITVPNCNKTPAKAFTPPAEKKIGTRCSFVKKVNE